MRDVTHVIENAELRFLNFKGVAGRYNSAGQRNFVIFLRSEDEQVMVRDGWKVKYLKPLEDGTPPQPYLQVKVSYAGKRPPKIMFVNSRGKREIPEDLVDLVDEAEIKTADVIVRQYPWEVNGNRGIAAYLKTLVITLDEDYLVLKYAHVNDLNLSPEEPPELDNVIEAEWFEEAQHAIGAS